MSRRIGFFCAVALLVFATSSVRAAIEVIDLTTAGNDSAMGVNGGIDTSDSGALFRVIQIDPQSTGTGVIDPFVRIQMKDNEDGYNTSLFGQSVQPPLDDIAGTWTHALQLSAVPIVTLGGVQYRQFMLDVNQNSGGDNELLSLNQIQIFQSSADRNDGSVTPDPQDTAGVWPLLSFPGVLGTTTTEVFRLNDGSEGPNNFEILLDYSLNHGSGSGDMLLYVEASAFIGLPYVILYSQFGTPPGASGSNDGFEEWSVIEGGAPPRDPGNPPVVPEPASMLVWGLLGLVTVGGVYFKRRAA